MVSVAFSLYAGVVASDVRVIFPFFRFFFKVPRDLGIFRLAKFSGLSCLTNVSLITQNSVATFFGRVITFPIKSGHH